MKNNTHTQATLDSDIHTTLKGYCSEPVASIQTDKALQEFERLSKHASEAEIHAHKGEYIFFFTRLVGALEDIPSSTVYSATAKSVKYTPKVVKLTDWFINQREREDALYKTRLKKLVQLLKRKNLPISTQKHQEWDESLAAKRKISLRNTRALSPETVYRCAFFGRGRCHRRFEHE